MSEDYGKVVSAFWRDTKIRPLDPDGKLLCLYYFTNPHHAMSGLYYCPFDFTARETGIGAVRVRELAMGPLSPFLTVDETTDEVLVHRLARRQIGEKVHPADKRLKGVLKQIEAAQSQRLRLSWYDLYRDWLTEGALEAPLQAPSKPATAAAAETVAAAVTATVTAAAGASARSPAVRATMSANAGLRANSIIAGRFNELTPNLAVTPVNDWLAAGIPIDLICETIERTAARYQPQPGRNQPHSIKYFDKAIRQAHAEAIASKTEPTSLPKKATTPLRDLTV